MKILITGSSGFIGKKIAEYYTKKNDVQIYSLKRNHNNISNEFLSINLNDLKKSKIKIDIIIHLSAKAHSKNYTKEDSNYNEYLANLLLDYSINIKIKKFIFLSSIKVNGEITLENNSFSEKSFTKTNDLYSTSKLSVENLIKEKLIKNNIEYYNIRTPLVIGANVKGNLKSLIKLISYGLPLPLKDISNKRSFITIADLIIIFDKIIYMKENKSGLYLACNSIPLSTSNLVDIINKSLNGKSNYFYINKNILKYFLILIGKKDIYEKLFSSLLINNKKIVKELKINQFSDIENEIKLMTNNYK